jgi:uridine kinase
MHTIQLKINDKIYESVIGLLKKIDKSDIEIIEEDKFYAQTKNYLETELNSVKEGSAEYVSLKELNQEIEKTIKKTFNL